jgi:hypothetical protein
MSDCTPASSFDSFLDVLRENRFRAGLEERFRLLRVLDAAQGRFSPSRLRTLLCPIFASNADEQHLFYALFEKHFPHFEVASAAGINSTPEDGPNPIPKTDPSGDTTEHERPGWRLIPLAAAVALLALLALFLSLHRPHTAVNEPQATKTGSQNTLSNSTPSAAAQGSRQEDSPALWQFAKSEPWTRPGKKPASWLWSLSLLIPVLGWGGIEAWAWFRRRAVLDRWAPECDAVPSQRVSLELEPGYGAGFLTALRRLRRPMSGPSRLNIARTVAATVRSAGFAEFRFDPAFRRPRYLVLIERASARDQQARLFEELTTALSQRGILVEAYTFSGDPRVCRSAKTGRTVYLADLYLRAPDHRLLVFGEGDRLINDLGDLGPAAGILVRWRNRIILTPRQPGEWRRQELQLARFFLLLPATTAALAAAVDHFDPDHARPIHHAPGKDVRRTINLDRAAPDEIRQILANEDLYTWLCACALYPNLQWDITLHLGLAINRNLLTETNLEKLLRLPWFRRGSMPVPVQQALVESLGESKRLRLRGAIVELLDSATPAAAGRLAAHRLEICIQRLDLLPQQRQSVMEDEALARIVSGSSMSDLALGVPPSLRKVLFPYGLPTLGLRTTLRHGLAMFAALTILGIGGAASHSRLFPALDEIGLNLQSPLPPPFAEIRTPATAASANPPSTETSSPPPDRSTRAKGSLTEGSKEPSAGPVAETSPPAGGAVPVPGGEKSKEPAQGQSASNAATPTENAGLGTRGAPTVAETGPPGGTPANPAPADAGASKAGAATEPPGGRAPAAVPDAESGRGVNTGAAISPPAMPRMHALIIGIATYRLPRIRPLPYADKDAATFAQFLRSARGGSLSSEQIMLLTNNLATRARIEEGFARLPAASSAADSVLLYISAEAAVENRGESYILAHDSDPEDLYDTAVPLSLIRQLILQLKVRRVLIFLDICQRPLGAPKQSKADSAALNKAIQQLSNTNNTSVVSANRLDGVASQDDKLGGGVFTHYLLQGLTSAGDQNADGTITVKELADYLQRNVANATKNQEQIQVYSNSSENLGFPVGGAKRKK